MRCTDGFEGVTFFIGYTEKGVTREAKQRVDESVLWEVARNGSSAVRDFLQQGPIRIMVEELMQDFLREMVEKEQSDAEMKALLSKGPLTIQGMEHAVTELLKRRRNDPPDTGCDAATGDVQEEG